MSWLLRGFCYWLRAVGAALERALLATGVGRVVLAAEAGPVVQVAEAALLARGLVLAAR